MQSLLTPFLLFIVAAMALVTYAIVPSISRTAIATGAAILLAIMIWWHWTQFSVEYRTSTWQEHLRNYASYIMVFVVILASYGFYAFAWQGAPAPAALEYNTSSQPPSSRSNLSEYIRSNFSNRNSSNRNSSNRSITELKKEISELMPWTNRKNNTQNFLL